jgi:cell division protein FtsN
LSRIAQGKADSAIALVDAHRSLLPASDYGLALALAGDSKRSVDVLVEAIRGDNASARTRQNLALAYALDGRWREARIMAVQDMPQDRVDTRIAEWAQYARPGAYQTRIAGLLKVTPREDAGQPVRLALGGAVSAPAMASVEETAPVAIAMEAAAPVGELPAIGAAPDVEGYAETNVRVAELAPSVPVEAPLIRAPEAPVKSAEAAPAAKPVKLALADVPAPQARVSSKFLVQLGAFSSTANATRAWSQLNRKHRILNGFDSASSTVTIKGRTLTRLAASGFGNYETAAAACRQIKMSGGECIVRSTDGSSPVRMAAKKPVRKAVRIAAR